MHSHSHVLCFWLPLWFPSIHFWTKTFFERIFFSFPLLRGCVTDSCLSATMQEKPLVQPKNPLFFSLFLFPLISLFLPTRPNVCCPFPGTRASFSCLLFSSSLSLAVLNWFTLERRKRRESQSPRLEQGWKSLELVSCVLCVSVRYSTFMIHFWPYKHTQTVFSNTIPDLWTRKKRNNNRENILKQKFRFLSLFFEGFFRLKSKCLSLSLSLFLSLFHFPSLKTKMMFSILKSESFIFLNFRIWNRWTQKHLKECDASICLLEHREN